MNAKWSAEILAVGLDLGNTLMTYDGVPLSWEAGYGNALDTVAGRLGIGLTQDAKERAMGQLRQYNTRLHPRDREVTARELFADVFHCAGLDMGVRLDEGVDAFFDCFRRSFTVYDDTLPFLRAVRRAGLPAGILTDVPYGMPARLVAQDVQPFVEWVRCVLSSGQVGWRKPRPEGFLALCAAIGVPPQGMVYIGDEPKDIAGAHAAGMRAILLDRGRAATGAGEDARVASLWQAAELLGLSGATKADQTGNFPVQNARGDSGRS